MVHVKCSCSLESIAKYCDCRDPRVSKGRAKVLFCQPQTQETKPVSLSLAWEASGHQPRGYIQASVTLLGWFLFLFFKEKIQLGHL